MAPKLLGESPWLYGWALILAPVAFKEGGAGQELHWLLHWVVSEQFPWQQRLLWDLRKPALLTLGVGGKRRVSAFFWKVGLFLSESKREGSNQWLNGGNVKEFEPFCVPRQLFVKVGNHGLSAELTSESVRRVKCRGRWTLSITIRSLKETNSKGKQRQWLWFWFSPLLQEHLGEKSAYSGHIFFKK